MPITRSIMIKMKELVVMWVFEDDSYQTILNLRKEAFKSSTDNHPHITFAHYESMDSRKLIAYTDQFIKQVECFNVDVDGINQFDQTIVLNIKFDNEIKRYYEIFHEKFSDQLNHFTQQENYIPHITLVTGDYQVESLVKVFKPLHLTINQCQISWIKEDGFEIIKTYTFKKVG